MAISDAALLRTPIRQKNIIGVLKFGLSRSNWSLNRSAGQSVSLRRTSPTVQKRRISIATLPNAHSVLTWNIYAGRYFTRSFQFVRFSDIDQQLFRMVRQVFHFCIECDWDRRTSAIWSTLGLNLCNSSNCCQMSDSDGNNLRNDWVRTVELIFPLVGSICRKIVVNILMFRFEPLVDDSVSPRVNFLSFVVWVSNRLYMFPFRILRFDVVVTNWFELFLSPVNLCECPLMSKRERGLVYTALVWKISFRHGFRIF